MIRISDLAAAIGRADFSSCHSLKYDQEGVNTPSGNDHVGSADAVEKRDVKHFPATLSKL